MVTSAPELPYRPTIPEIVRRAASMFGDDDYIVTPDDRISFAESEAASRHLAKRLLARGVGKGARVGIHLATGPRWATAFLAVTRIGAIAMPFSTLYRPAELRTALRVGDVAILLSSTRLLGKDNEAFLEESLPALPGSTAGHLRIYEAPFLRSIWLHGDNRRDWALPLDGFPAAADEPFEDIDDLLLAAVESEVSPADALAAVFTSGTTADPKAVVISQGAAIRKTSPGAAAALNAIFGGRVLSLMPFFWVGGMQEVLAALQSGAALLTLERLDAESALDLGKREQATSFIGNPQAMRSLLGDTDISSVIPSLRPTPVRPWQGGPSSKGDMATGIGMTETFGPWTNIEGIECRIVNPDTGEPCSEGEVGEFYLRGYGLMQAIYKCEREEVFTADGFYATGDLGYQENGLYYFRTRLKDMIKTKGANVAPAEVEAVLNSRPEVRISFVVGLPHEIYGEEVAAAVVAADGCTVDVDELRAYCRRVLSPYKVPAMITVLEQAAIPQLSSSKPDRRAITATLAGRRAQTT